MAAPAFGTSGTWASTGTTTLSLAVPASVASGDVLVVEIFIDGSTVTVTGPTGFAHAPNSPRTVNAGGAGNHSVNVLWKRASAGDTGTYDFTLSASGYAEGQTHRYTTCIASGNPWDGNTSSTADGGATNSSTTPAVSFTTTGPDELLFFAGTCWAGGSWTPPSGFSERTDNASDVTADDKVQTTAGSSGTVQATCTGNDKVGAWLGALIGTTVSGSLDARVSIAAQQSSVTRIPPVVVAPTIGPPQVIRLPQIEVLQFPRVLPAPFPVAVNPPLLPAQVIRLPQIVVAPQAQLPQPPAISVSAPQIPAVAAGILPLATAVVAEQFRPAAVAPIVVTPPPLPQPAAPIWVNPSSPQPALAAVVAITPPLLPPFPAPVTVVPSRPQPALAATIALTPSPLPQAVAPVVVVTSTWQPCPPQIVVSQPQFPAVAGILPPAPILTAPAFTRPGFPPTAVSPPQLLGPSALPPAPILVAPTFTRFRLAPVFVLAGAAICDCTTHRPNTGITARPTSGTTSRPNTGVTTRPCTC